MKQDIIKKTRYKEWVRLGKDLFNDEHQVLIYAMQLILYSDPSTKNPYHNPQHMMAVALRACNIYLETDSDDDHSIKINNAQNLFIAASLHDVAHSAGKQSDTINIEKAVAYTDQLLIDFGMNHKSKNGVLDIIRCTQYPFVTEPKTLAQQCIRDADLLMCLEPDWDEFFDGLKTELSLPEMTEEDNLKWISQQKFYTTKGKELVCEYLSVKGIL